MKIIGAVVVVALLLALAGCSGQSNSQAWSMTGSASCSGLCIGSGNVTQTMPQPDADKTLFAAALLAVGAVLLVGLALGGAL